MNYSLSLFRLQQVDTQTDRFQARLQIIQRTLEDDGEVRSARDHAEKTESEFKSAQRSLHLAENAVRDLRIKIEQTESSLYSNTIRNPKELQELQNDVAALKRQLERLEDAQLEAMMAFDDVLAGHRSAKTEFVSISDRSLQKNHSLLEERTLLLKKVEQLGAERTAITRAIPVDILSMYEALRIHRRGVAVATVTDNACSACGTTLTPMQIQNIITATELTYCPTCGRILYFS